MIKDKTNKRQFWITMAVLFLFLSSFIISGFPVQARAPVVVIQPGHSIGYDSGAVNTSTGVQEADVNAAVAAKIAAKLQQQGYTVYLTHPVPDCSIRSLLTNAEANSLSNIAKAVNKINPDLEISIHHNSGGSSASGYEFYWSSYRDFDQEGVHEVSGLWPGDMAYQDISPCAAAQQSKAFATILESNFSGIGINFRKTVERDDYVQAHVTCPSVLIEGGFISNNSESLLLASDAYQEKMSARIVNSINQYFGNTEIDETAPTIESITNSGSPTTDTVFTIYANGVKDSGSGVRDVSFAVWSETNGQDDLVWYSGIEVENGQWKVDIDIQDHNNELGNYIVHVYASDYAGNRQGVEGKSISVVQINNILDGVNISEISPSGFKVTAKNLGTYTDLKFPVWSENGGQDDIIWYQGIRQTDGSYRVNVDTNKHNNDVGKYNVHVYGVDKNGNMIGLYATTTTVPQMTAESITTSEVNDGKFTVTVSGIKAPAGISGISVPVWSDNGGQDDLIWYTAKKKDATTYTVEVNLKDHGYDVGVFNVHAYGTDKNGKMVVLGTTTTTVPQMTAESITTSEVNDGKFTVTVSGIKAPAGISGISVPVWSDNGGQDDLIWYTAKKKDATTYTVEVNLKDHGYDVGVFNVHAYGTDKNEKKQFLSGITVNIITEDVPDKNTIVFSTKTYIIGNTTKSAQELANYFNSKATFPTSFYGISVVDFADIYIEECRTEGVRPEVAFAQMCLETGYLQYGGDVKREQFNFAGIGAIGNGAPGNSFADVRTGIRAQVQHLKAYASTEGLVNECVDPRYQYVNKGCAPTVGDLAGKWATDPNYGNKLVTIMNAF